MSVKLNQKERSHYCSRSTVVKQLNVGPAAKFGPHEHLMCSIQTRLLDSGSKALSRIPGAHGSLGQQVDCFRKQFLKIARKSSSTKERGDFLKLAFMATLKGENARGADDAMAQYREHLARMNKQSEEGCAWSDECLPKLDAEAERILRYFQTTPYRTKDRDRSDQPLRIAILLRCTKTRP